jgi:hypothetical protein
VLDSVGAMKKREAFEIGHDAVTKILPNSLFPCFVVLSAALQILGSLCKNYDLSHCFVRFKRRFN